MEDKMKMNEMMKNAMNDDVYRHHVKKKMKKM
jgi:hypothetical protein